MGYKLKVAVMSIIAFVLLAGVAFEVYYFFFKDKTDDVVMVANN